MGNHQHIYDGDGWTCMLCGECRCTQHEPHEKAPTGDGQIHWAHVVGKPVSTLLEEIVEVMVDKNLSEEQPIGDLLRALRGER